MAGRQGERRDQISQTLASMLENPRVEKITTKALAEQLGVSEAALYRHFASKAQMYEKLIEFIESTLFSLINKIQSDSEDGCTQAEQITSMLLGFAEKNPGMTRVLTGEALVHEDERLQQRINQIFERIEACFRQSLRIAQLAEQLPREHDHGAHASVLAAYVTGRWQLFVKTGFKRRPQDGWEAQRSFLLTSCNGVAAR